MAEKEKTLRVTQVKSVIACPEKQRRTMRALGLRHIGASVDHVDNECIRGMIFQVKHLVKVEEI